MVRQFLTLSAMRDFVLHNPVLSWSGDPDDDLYSYFDNTEPGLYLTFDSYEDLALYYSGSIDPQIQFF